MNKDRVEGKAKDVAGRIERQAGEWAGDLEKQVHGAAKQVEGKVQNAWGQAKDATDDASARTKARKKSESDELLGKEEIPGAEKETDSSITARRKAS